MTEPGPFTGEREVPESRDSYDVHFGASLPMLGTDHEGYVVNIRGSVRWERLLVGGGSTGLDGVAGTIEAWRVFADRAARDNHSLWDLCDACHQNTADAYEVLFERDPDEEESLRPELQTAYPDAITDDFLLISLVEVSPEHRGKGLGMLMARRLMDIFEPDLGIVLLKPFPLQFSGRQGRSASDDARYTGLCRSEPEAFVRLRRYWSRLGFTMLPGSEYMSLCTAYVHPSTNEVLRWFGHGD